MTTSNPNLCITCHTGPRPKLKWGWMNIYRSGHFHREGKPNTYDRHAGDIYASREEALAQIDPPSHYIDTVAFGWMDEEDIQVNPPESVPVSLSASRKAFQEQYALAKENH